MKKSWLVTFILVAGSLPVLSQNELKPLNVSELKWELDYQIYLKLANDSAYNYDIRELFHITGNEPGNITDYIYYPVNLGTEYVNDLNRRSHDDEPGMGHKTLWSALHATLGGDWVHFTNCLLYSLETRQLSLTAPLMKRPDSKWKPDPVTDSYRRTKKWQYYTPVKQAETVKEYKLRNKRNELADLTSVPDEFTQLALKTNDKALIKLKEKGDHNSVAKIELVKLLLGVNFLGEAQINYISAAVLNAVKSYSENKLPSVIIFDKYDAAAVMTLSPAGYQIDAIVFKKSADLSDSDKQLQTSMIVSIIDKINEYNHNSFVKRLGNYYQK